MSLRSSAIVAVSFTALIVVGAIRWREALPKIGHQSIPIGLLKESPGELVETTLIEVEERIVSNDPFRLSNSPSSIRYSPSSDNVGFSASGPLRPNLTLKAIVGGPPWQAIVDGIPGQQQGTLVRAGSAFDKLIARAVTRDSVVIQGPDTTWVLSFRRRE
jgi:hypothetical protein